MAVIRVKRSYTGGAGTQLLPGELAVYQDKLYFGPKTTSGETAVTPISLVGEDINNSFTEINTFRINTDSDFEIRSSGDVKKTFAKTDGFLYTVADISDIESATNKILVSREYVEGKIQGLDIRDSVKVLYGSNVSNFGAAPNQIDDIWLYEGDRILLIGQTTSNENGIYVVTNQGASAGTSTDVDAVWARADDLAGNDVINSVFVFVEQGTSYADTGWVQSNGEVTVGVDSMEWTQFSSAGVATADGTTLTKNGTEFSITDGGVDTTQLADGAVSAIKLADNAVDLAGAKITGTLGSGNGGTGFTTYAKGDLIYASGIDTLSKLAIGSTENQVLAVNSSGGYKWIDSGTMIDKAASDYFAVAGDTIEGETLIAPLSTLDGGGDQDSNSITFQYFDDTLNSVIDGPSLYMTSSEVLKFGTEDILTTGNVQYTEDTWRGITAGGNTLAADEDLTLTGESEITISELNGTVTIGLNTAYGDTVNPYGSKTANYVLAAPNGSAGTPSFRALVSADIPTLNQDTTGEAGSVANTLTITSDGGSTEGTSKYTFDGSASKTINLVGGTNISIAETSGTLTFNSDLAEISEANIINNAGSTTGLITGRRLHYGLGNFNNAADTARTFDFGVGDMAASAAPNSKTINIGKGAVTDNNSLIINIGSDSGELSGTSSFQTNINNVLKTRNIKDAGYFYTAATNPTNTNRLNYDGNFYATEFIGLVDGGTTW